MEETILRKFYNKYLNEVFDCDLIDYNNLNFIFKYGSYRSCFLNSKTKEVNFYDEIKEFNCGFARVSRDGKFNYIDKSGELLSTEWFTKAYDFNFGYALVYRDETANFIDINGNFLFEKWLPFIEPGSRMYQNGVFIINHKFEGPYVINKQGRKIFSDSFDSISPFIGKNAIATKKIKNHDKNKKIGVYWKFENYVIDVDGNSYKSKFTNLIHVEEDIFVASENNKHFLVDKLGNRIGNILFDNAKKPHFKNGYMIICNNNKYNLLSRDGNLLSKDWYDEIKDFVNGFWIVRLNGKYNYLDKNGNLLSLTWFEEAKPFINNGTVKLNGMYYYIKTDGSLSEGFANEKDLEYYIFSSNNHKEKTNSNLLGSTIEKKLKMVLDRNLYVDYEFPDGHLLSQDGFLALDWQVRNPLEDTIFCLKDKDLYIFNYDGEVIFSINLPTFYVHYINLEIELVEELSSLRKVKGTKRWFHYNYEVEGNKYLLDYEPLVDYGDIIICADETHFYVFDKKTLNTTLLGLKAGIILEYNYIKIGEKKYFISGTDLIDITELPFRQKISKKDGIDKILTFSEFRDLCKTPEYQEKIDAEINRLKESIAKEKEKKLIEDAQKIKEQELKAIEEKKSSLKESLKSLSEILSECAKYINEIELLMQKGDSIKKVKIPLELLLIPVSDHLEINPIFLNNGILRYVDLSLVSFTNVKVAGVDLSYTNARINPEEVYNKDMSNGKYCGLDFNLGSFKDVNITNSDFKDAILDFSLNSEEIKKGFNN